MDRAQFNSCISDGMRGKTFTKEQRKLAFCVTAKICAGKVKDRAEAERICSLPKAPKPEGSGKHRDKKGAGAAPACDYTILIPACERKLGMMVKSGELGPETDVPGICRLILE